MCDAKYAAHPLLCLYIQVKCITKKIENEVHTSRTNMQQCAPPQGSTLLIVPQYQPLHVMWV